MDNTVKVITRTEYVALAKHGFAGTAASLSVDTIRAWMSRQGTDWTGDHWTMWNDGGTVLGPVNVEG